MIARPILHRLFAMVLAYPLALLAQDSTAPVPRIDHPLSDGTWSPPPPPVPLPERPVLEETEYVLPAEGRSIIVQRVVPPDQPPPAPPETSDLTEEELVAAKARFEAAAAEYKANPPRMVTFSCTVYDLTATRVRWMHEGTEYVAWSNIDWNDFAGLGSFIAGEKQTRHMVMLGLGNVDNDSVLPNGTTRADGTVIPELPTDGPGFVLVKGDPTDVEAMRDITTMHALYRAEGTRLHESRLKREQSQREQEAWRKANPQPPRDTVIQFGRKGKKP